MVVVVMGDHYLRLAIVIPRGLHKGEDLVRTLATFVTARPQWSRGGGWRESPQTWRLGEPPAVLSHSSYIVTYIKYCVAFFVLLFFPLFFSHI